jgi:hypothetical protein
MAQWRCGRQENAREAYQQAAKRMEKSFRTQDSVDRAIKAEASALLGIPEQPTPKTKEVASQKD